MDNNKIEQFQQSYSAQDYENLKLLIKEYIIQSSVSLDTLFDKINGFKEEANTFFEGFLNSFEINRIKGLPLQQPTINHTSTDSIINTYDITSIKSIFSEAIEELCS